MSEEKKLQLGKLKRLPSLLIKIFIVLMLVLSFVICANKIMEFGKIKEQNALLAAERDALLDERDNLQYYLGAELNDQYREAMARKEGYYYPDEIIYFVE